MSIADRHIPGADASDRELTVSVFSKGFDLSSGVARHNTRRIQLDDGVTRITVSMKTLLPLCKMLLDMVQVDIVSGGELVRGADAD